LAKFERNVERDNQNKADLRAQGWRVKTIWECETREIEALTREVQDFLSDQQAANP